MYHGTKADHSVKKTVIVQDACWFYLLGELFKCKREINKFTIISLKNDFSYAILTSRKKPTLVWKLPSFLKWKMKSEEFQKFYTKTSFLESLLKGLLKWDSIIKFMKLINMNRNYTQDNHFIKVYLICHTFEIECHWL